MNSSHNNSNPFQLLAFGFMLALLKLVYMFFDASGIADFIVFIAAGFLLGGRVPAGKKWYALLLALPAFFLCLVFVIRLGYASLAEGVGTSYAVSLVVIPLATMLGFFIYTKRTGNKTEGKNG